MMRLPLFEFCAPRTIEEAARILDGEGSKTVPIAGGTALRTSQQIHVFEMV
jgi:CO/xanthine dehydrogenase FAD-binding subunit